MTSRMIGAVVCLCLASNAWGQSTGQVRGRVTDETGGALPGVTVDVRSTTGAPMETVTNASGEYAFEYVSPGRYQLAFRSINFAAQTRGGCV